MIALWQLGGGGFGVQMRQMRQMGQKKDVILKNEPER
jgi:hypothetical protein